MSDYFVLNGVRQWLVALVWATGSLFPWRVGAQPDPLQRHDANTFDYIVVGAGAAGSVVAARLAQASKSVLLLEAGPDTSIRSGVPDLAYTLTLPLTPLYALAHSFDPDLTDPFACSQLVASQVHLDFVSPNQGGDNYFGYPRGTGAGGTAQIAAGGVDGVGSLKLYDMIAEKVKDPYWRGENVLRLAKKMEHAYPPRDPATYGSDGWLNISRSTIDIQDPIYDSIIQSANARGIPTQTDFRAKGNESGIGLVDSSVFSPFASLGVGDGLRSFSYKDLLLPVALDANKDLEVRFNSLVSRVLLESEPPEKASGVSTNYKAIGVEVLEGAYIQKVQPGGGVVTDGLGGNCLLTQPNRLEPEIKRYYAREEVIVSAGTIQTPQLLQLSGIGDRNHLASVGIHPLVHLPGVGRNFMDHTEIFVQFEMDPSRWFSNNLATLLGILGLDQFISDDAIRAQIQSRIDPRILAENQVALVLDWPSGVAGATDLKRPDIHAFTWTSLAPVNFDGRDLGPHPLVDEPADPHEHLSRFFSPDPENPTARPGLPNAYQTIFAPLTPPQPRAFFTWLIENVQPGKTTGSVMVRNNNPTEEPLIDAGLYRDDVGLERLAAGVQLIRKIMGSPTIKAMALNPDNFELYPGSKAGTNEELKEYIRTWSAYGHHASGTAAMGAKNDKMAVVDSRLRVRRVIGLRVADTSVYPSPLIAPYNTTRAAYIIGEAAAEFILEEHSQK
jgi:choline dehydrogenase